MKHGQQGDCKGRPYISPHQFKIDRALAYVGRKTKSRFCRLLNTGAFTCYTAASDFPGNVHDVEGTIMFESSPGDEKALPIDLGIQWDTGAPLPHLLRSEYRTFLTFYLNEQDPDWNGARSAPAHIAIIEWHRCSETLLGWPNDEALSGHRLWERGLKETGHYGAAEVRNSSWIAEIEKGNRVHPRHRPERFAALRHYILLFHDSTFECLAEGYTITKVFKPMPEVLLQLAHRLIER